MQNFAQVSRIARIRRNDSKKISKFTKAIRPEMDGMFHALFLDLKQLCPIYRDTDLKSDLKTLFKRLECEGLGFISKGLPDYFQSVCDVLEGHRTLNTSFVGFKKTPNGYPAFLGRLTHEVLNDGPYAAISFECIYQICVAFKKLRGPYRQESLRIQMRNFVENDDRLSRLNFNSDITRPILLHARNIITRLFKNVKYDDLDRAMKPRPGPGATNTPVEKHMRFAPHVVYDRVHEEFNYLEYFYGFHHWNPVDDAARWMSLPHKDEAESRFRFVDKYLFKPRGICIEENECQFFQQGVKNFLYNFLERHSYTKGHVNFRDQTINQQKAFESSKNLEDATLDMKDGSDNIARVLVHLLFLDTVLLETLDSVSTRIIRLPEQQMLAHKFAPMGSGVCFPIMSLVHYVLVRAIIELSALEDSRDLAEKVYVYGDDIVIPSKACEAVFTYLPYFGMKLNTTKSFVNSHFRESCGVHAYNSVDVTPVYVNYLIKNSRSAHSDTQSLLSLLAKESSFEVKGWKETASQIRRSVERIWGKLPMVDPRSRMLGFSRENHFLEHADMVQYAKKYKWDDDLCKHRYLVRVISPLKNETQILHQGESYLRKLLTYADDPWNMPGETTDLTVGWKWV